MKIGHLDTKTAPSSVGERRTPASRGAAAAAEPSARVALSPTLDGVGGGADGGVFDAAKVQRISEAIRRGEYVIDAEAIADKLLVNARELLGNGPGGPASPGRA